MDNPGGSAPISAVHLVVNMEEVHEISLDLLRSLEDSGVEVNLARVAVAMTLGRLAAPEGTEQEEMVKYIQSVLEFSGMYFVSGTLQ